MELDGWKASAGQAAVAKLAAIIADLDGAIAQRGMVPYGQKMNGTVWNCQMMLPSKKGPEPQYSSVDSAALKSRSDACVYRGGT
eukprot:5553379-Amphidinium_carterae.1